LFNEEKEGEEVVGVVVGMEYLVSLADVRMQVIYFFRTSSMWGWNIWCILRMWGYKFFYVFKMMRRWGCKFFKTRRRSECVDGAKLCSSSPQAYG
jgi:hypothetical protein